MCGDVCVWSGHARQGIDKQQLMYDVKDALYAAKVTSYAQGMNIIRAKSEAMGWNIDLGGLARIWKVCTPLHLLLFVTSDALLAESSLGPPSLLSPAAL